MVPRSLAGITVSLMFKPHKPDTCQSLLRESACTVQLLIISWGEIFLVSEIVQYLISPCIITLLSMKILITKEFVSWRYNFS